MKGIALVLFLVEAAMVAYALTLAGDARVAQEATGRAVGRTSQRQPWDML